MQPDGQIFGTAADVLKLAQNQFYLFDELDNVGLLFELHRLDASFVEVAIGLTKYSYFYKLLAASISICESPIATMLVKISLSIFSTIAWKVLYFHSLKASKQVRSKKFTWHSALVKSSGTNYVNAILLSIHDQILEESGHESGRAQLYPAMTCVGDDVSWSKVC